MARHGEDFSGGLVTTKDPAFLSEGQLSECQNAVYTGPSLSLYRCQGRSLFASSVNGSVDRVVGLDTLFFTKPNQQFLLSHSGSALATAQTGTTGTWGTVENVLPGNTLTTIQARGGYIILNGSGAQAGVASGENLNRYWYWGHDSAATATGESADYLRSRPHGMLAVNSSPAGDQVVTASGPGFPSVLVTGYYDYWTTESIKYSEYSQDYYVESTFSGNPQSVYVSAIAAGACPVIQRPGQTNSGATHWSVYRSAQKSASGQQLWPAGIQVQRLDIQATSYADGGAGNSQGPSKPREYNLPLANPYDTYGNLGSWIGASALASGNSGSAIVPAENYERPFMRRNWQGFYDFGLSQFDGNVVGIEVKATAVWATSDINGHVWNSSNHPARDGMAVRIGPRRAGSYAGAFSGVQSVKNSGAKASGVTYGMTFGGPTDRWFLGETNKTSYSDWASGASKWQVALGAASCTVGGLSVKLYYGTPAVATGELFQSIIIENSGVTTACGEDGPPPVATTGDFFKGSLVLNSVNEENLIRWSTPDKFDSFPELYWMEIPVKRGDKVRAIRTLGRTLVVGARHSLFRVNYLPGEDDSNFQRGLALDVLDSEHGILDPKATAFFTSPSDGRTYLAYVSMDGIRSTDGFSVQLLTPQLDWDRMATAEQLSAQLSTFLTNHVTNHELRLYLCGSATASANDRYHLNYHPNHLGGGSLKVSGPVKMDNVVAAATAFPSCAVSFRTASNSMEHHFIGYTDGSVYKETALGSAAPWNAGASADQVSTRRMYLSGMGNEWRLNQVYLHGVWPTTAPSVEVWGTKTGSTESLLGLVEYNASATAASAVLDRGWARNSLEGGRLKACGGVQAWRLDSLILDGEDFGGEDSGT